LLWYLARRRARQAENGPIEGTATRIDARRSNGQTAKKARTRAGTRTRRSSENAATT
jgi:hypothetical protein